MHDPAACRGLRVFAVEDESLVAMQLEDILEDLGCVVVGMAMRVSRAMDMLDAETGIDIAILDMNIAGEKVYPVAERLRHGGVPIVFATGYGRSGVADEWQTQPILQKPYTGAKVSDAIIQARLDAQAAGKT